MAGSLIVLFSNMTWAAPISGNPDGGISLGPTTLPDDVDMTQSSLNVYPTKGAVVLANFATRVGYQVMVTLLQNNTPVPFGALVMVENTSGSEPNTGIVGDDGQVYLSGLPEQGALKVKWGNGAAQQCNVVFNLANTSAPSKNNPVRMLTVQCERE